MSTSGSTPSCYIKVFPRIISEFSSKKIETIALFILGFSISASEEDLKLWKICISKEYLTVRPFKVT